MSTLSFLRVDRENHLEQERERERNWDGIIWIWINFCKDKKKVYICTYLIKGDKQSPFSFDHVTLANILLCLMMLLYLFCFRWFCHFDDDNYVNIPRLVTLLSDYNPQEDWYLGKRSIKTPLKILNREGKNKTSKQVRILQHCSKYIIMK